MGNDPGNREHEPADRHLRSVLLRYGWSENVGHIQIAPGGPADNNGQRARNSPGWQSFNIVLQDRGQPLQTGWSELDYDSTSDRLGGFSIFRQIIPGRPAFEALVPLSSIDDSRFFMPFDNL